MSKPDIIVEEQILIRFFYEEFKIGLIGFKKSMRIFWTTLGSQRAPESRLLYSTPE